MKNALQNSESNNDTDPVRTAFDFGLKVGFFRLGGQENLMKDLGLLTESLNRKYWSATLQKERETDQKKNSTKCERAEMRTQRLRRSGSAPCSRRASTISARPNRIAQCSGVPVCGNEESVRKEQGQSRETRKKTDVSQVRYVVISFVFEQKLKPCVPVRSNTSDKSSTVGIELKSM
jgi:hypothetical protein